MNRKTRLLLSLALLIVLGVLVLLSPIQVAKGQTLTPPVGIDLIVSKTHTGNAPASSQNFPFTIVVTNQGNQATTGAITLTDTLPQAFAFDASTAGTNWTCSAAGQIVTCTYGIALGPGQQSSPLTLVTDVRGGPVGSQTNQVTVATPGDVNNTNDFAADNVTVTGNPTITIDKSHIGNFTVGVPNTYKVTVTNNGSADTFGDVTVTDTPLVTGRIVFTGFTGNGWTCPTLGATAQCIYSNIIPAFGQSADLTLNVNPLQPAPAPGFNNQVVAVTAGSANANDVDPTIIIAAPDLSMTKTFTTPPGFVVNVPKAFTLTVTNAAGAGSTNGNTITITDTLPAPLTYTSFTSTTPGWTCGASGQVVTCTNSSALAAGASSTVDITVTPNTTSGTPITNSAAVSVPGEVATGDNTATSPPFTIGNIDIAVTKSHTPAGAIPVGVDTVFTITLTNQGGVDTGGLPITITEQVPSGTTYQAFATGTAVMTCTPATGQAGPLNVTCNSTVNIPAAGSVSFTISLRPSAPIVTPNSNTAVLTNFPVDNDPSDNTATDPFTVSTFDLSLTKTANGTFARGTTGQTFVIRATNVGPPNVLTSGPIIIRDTLPSGINFVSAAGAGWACALFSFPGDVPVVYQCTYTGPALNRNQFTEVTITVATDITAPLGQATNTATLPIPSGVPGAANDLDGNTANNTAQAVIDIVPAPAPDLTVTKTFSATPTVGTPLTFDVTVTNVGNAATAGNITLQDTLPSGWTGATGTGGGWACTVSGVVMTCTYTGAPLGFPAGSTTVQITATPGSTGAFTNSVTVSLPPTQEPNTSNNTATATGTVGTSPAAEIGITKTAPQNFVSPPTPPNQNGQYILHVQNNGSVAATTGAVTITDNLPAGFTLVTSAISGPGAGAFPGTPCTAVGQTVTCNNSVGAFPPSPAFVDITLTVVVPTGLANGSTVSNTASVTFPDSNPANNQSTIQTTVTTTAAPDVTITKTHTGQFNTGQPATYDITVTNIGSGATTADIIVTDTLPAGLTFASGTGPGGFTCTAAGQVVTCTRPATNPLNAGAPALIQLNVTVTATGGTLTNTATVATTGDANATNNSASDPTVIGGAVDLTVAKSHTGNFFIGQLNAQYTIQVSNIGNQSTTGAIQVVDTLPAGLTYNSVVSGPFTCSAAGATVTCNYTGPALTGVGGANQATLVLRVNVVGPAATVINQAQVSGGGDTTPGNNTATDSTLISASAVADLVMGKQGPAAFGQGTNGNYTLTVTNNGSGPTTGTITVTDTLPAGLSFVSTTAPGWTCTGGTTVTCTNPGPMAPGSVATIILTVNPTIASGSVTNTATVSGGGDADPSNNSASVTTPISGVPDLSVSKVHGANFTQNQSNVYTITVQNVGSGPTTAPITLTDTLPAGMTLVSANGAGWTCTGTTTVTCTYSAVLAAGPTLLLDLTVLPSAAGSFTNSVTVATTGDTNTANNTATDPTTVIAPNPAAISPTQSTISATPTSVLANGSDFSTVTVTVRLNSGAPAVGVSVTLFGTPAGATATPSTTVFTDGSGNAVFQVRSTTAQTYTLTATATNGFGTVIINGSASVTFTSTTAATATPGGTGTVGGAISTANSTLTTTCIRLPADNVTTASITATLKNSSGGPVPGKTVTLTGNPALSGMTIQPVSATSDSNGSATFTVRSVTQGTVTFNAVITSDSITYGNLQIQFTAPGTQCVAPAPGSAAAGGTATATPAPGSEALLTPPGLGPNIGMVVPFRLRVRTGPGLNFPVIGRLRAKTIVVLIAKNRRGTWFLIKLDEQGHTGWVSAFYIRVRRLTYRFLPIFEPQPGAPTNPVVNLPPSGPTVTPTNRP